MKFQMKSQYVLGISVFLCNITPENFADGNQILSSTMLGVTGLQFLALGIWMLLTLSWTMASCLASMPLDLGWDSNSLTIQMLDGLELAKLSMILWLFFTKIDDKEILKKILGLEALMHIY